MDESEVPVRLPPMKLSALIQDLPDARVVGDPNVDIDVDVHVGRVCDDSRTVEPGDVFVAVRGLRTDGHAHIERAVEKGAGTVVVEDEQSGLPAGTAQVVVENTLSALGALAARRAGRPAERMDLIGITGTNGKTTTTYLVEAILHAAGARPGVIGTVNYRYAGRVEPAAYTTPTPVMLHQALAQFADADCTHAAMEVSSIGLSMGRMAGVSFNVAAFSNLSQDHLDMHGTMDEYRRAKALLFAEHLASAGVAVINIDDPSSGSMLAAVGPNKQQTVLRVTCAPGASVESAEIRVVEFESTIAGIRARIATPRGVIDFRSDALIGHYNVANLALAVGITEALGVAHEAMARGIAEMTGVPGRVERVANERGLDILVDYAHTPDALENVLSALKPLARGRLICVFGCGGDRDPGKRSIMGAAVSAGADLPVVTSDNPRTEDPQSILDAILPAVPDPFYVDVDRARAIRAAVAEANPGDIVLIAGKGHEDYQILGTEKVHFDDREQAAEAVAERWYFSLADIVRVTGGALVHRPAADPATGPDTDPGTGPVEFGRVHYDSRMAAPGDLYVAVRGDSLDGHDFCAQAIAAGATGVIIETGAKVPENPDGTLIDGYVIAVASGRENGGMLLDGGRMALGRIAEFHRRRWQTDDAPNSATDGAPTTRRPLVAITGSAGKTTTKELAVATLSSLGPVHATGGSFNNETGVPFTLLGLRRFHRAAVVEMGMRGLGQIDYLVRMAGPTVGAVVNAGSAHVGVVGSVEQIAEGKSEVFGRLDADGVAVLPADDPRLARHAARAPATVTFGAHPNADVRLVDYRVTGDATGADLAFAIRGEQLGGHIALPGRHHADNAACAVAVAVAAGVSARDAVAALGRAQPASMRGEVVDIAGRRVLLDCYNANPIATAAALRTLRELAGDRPGLAVLGDMLELGEGAAAAHAEVGRLAAELDIAVISLGEYRAHVAAGAGDLGVAIGGDNHVDGHDSIQAAARRALADSKAGDWLVVKASRGMRLERVVRAMRTLAEEA